MVFVADKGIDGYRLMTEHNVLLIDLTIAKHKGRNEIYSICHNAYGWSGFWDEIFLQLELENIGMLHQIFDLRINIFKQFIEKYIIEIRTNRLLTLWIAEKIQPFLES